MIFYTKIKNLIRGVSIIETIVYLAIFTMVSIVVINSFIISLSSFSSIRKNHDLLNSGTIAMDRISYEIRQAKNINLTNGNSVFDSDSSVLRLDDTDGSSYVTFSKVSNGLNIAKNGTSVGNLLAQNITLNKLIFRRISTANSEAVKIEIELQDTRGKINKIERFYDTVVLRGGY